MPLCVLIAILDGRDAYNDDKRENDEPGRDCGEFREELEDRNGQEEAMDWEWMFCMRMT